MTTISYRQPVVIVPTKNRKELILRTIKELQRQSYPDFHAIIVNHNSTDGTEEALESVKDSRFKIIHHTGYPDAAWSPKNAALRNLPSDTLGVIFRDDDDLFYSEESIAYLVNAAKTAGDRFGVCAGDYVEINCRGEVIGKNVGKILSSSDIIDKCWFPVKASIFSYDLVRDLRQLPPIRSRETILWAYFVVRLIETRYLGVKEVKYTGKTIVKKVRHPDAISIDNQQKGCRESAEILMQNIDMLCRQMWSEPETSHGKSSNVSLKFEISQHNNFGLGASRLAD